MDTEYDTIAMVKASDKTEKKYLGLGVDSGGNLYKQTIRKINLNPVITIKLLHECICMCVLCMYVQYAYVLACNQEFIMLAHRKCCTKYGILKRTATSSNLTGQGVNNQ